MTQCCSSSEAFSLSSPGKNNCSTMIPILQNPHYQFPIWFWFRSSFAGRNCDKQFQYRWRAIRCSQKWEYRLCCFLLIPMTIIRCSKKSKKVEARINRWEFQMWDLKHKYRVLLSVRDMRCRPTVHSAFVSCSFVFLIHEWKSVLESERTWVCVWNSRIVRVMFLLRDQTIEPNIWFR